MLLYTCKSVLNRGWERGDLIQVNCLRNENNSVFFYSDKLGFSTSPDFSRSVLQLRCLLMKENIDDYKYFFLFGP